MAIVRGWPRVVFVGALTVFLIYSFHRSGWLRGDSQSVTELGPSTDVSSTLGPHPIDRLIAESRTQLRALLGKRTLTLEQAASRYRERRRRHPPPGFDAWVKAALDSDAILVEDFFDRIYDDLAPLWALDPATMRRQTHKQPQLIRVRGGKATFETDNPKRPPWIQNWAKLLTEIAEHLPDLDMVLNIMDEVRLLVPWEQVDKYVHQERASRRMMQPSETIATYSGLADIDADIDAPPYEHSWVKNDQHHLWDYLAASCPPDSPGRNVTSLPSFDVPIEYPRSPHPAYTRDGFIFNTTAARDPCLQPYLRSLHGTFIEGISMSTSRDLFPMFAGCKLPQNNEILIPGAMYLTDDPFYSGGDQHGDTWDRKKTGFVWRGAASGGRNKADTWWHFQRHRWVQMTNSTTVAAVESTPDGVDRALAPTFELPPEAMAAYQNLTARRGGRLGPWLSTFADTGFVDLECFPRGHKPNGDRDMTCPYTSPLFEVASNVPMREQYGYKFVPDVDGNSYSARWRSFLRSTSMPLKSTIYAEWHDDRLFPWVHYVPFDISYMDLYAVLDYFIDDPMDSQGLRGHDAAARRIAEESRSWAEAVLRRKDMQLYVWRLLLEYARVVDDNRDRLAFVDDLRS